jgi:hypothetical protein
MKTGNGKPGRPVNSDKEAPSTSPKEQRIPEGHQYRRLRSLSFIDSRRSIHPGSRWFHEGGTQAHPPDGPSPWGLCQGIS